MRLQRARPAVSSSCPLAFLFAAAASIAMVSCGEASPRSEQATTIIEHTITVSREIGPIDADDYAVLNFGSPANARQLRDIDSLIKRYYRAAAAGNGGDACRLLFFVTVRTTVMDEYERESGLHGHSCAEVLTKLFALHRRELAEDLVSLRIVRVRVHGINGFVVLRVPWSRSARQLSVRLVGGRWRVQQQPIDKPMP